MKIGDKGILKVYGNANEMILRQSKLGHFIDKEIEITGIVTSGKDTFYGVKRIDAPIYAAEINSVFIYFEPILEKPKMRLELYEDKVNKKTYYRLTKV